jgi:hypothetical protein
MRLCVNCSPNPQSWGEATAPPGRCAGCGQPFDIQGVPIADEAVSCPVHHPILASCPHAEADARAVAVASPSWLGEGTGAG